MRGLTFEVSLEQRQDAKPGPAKMYPVPLARAWWPAVGPRLDRGVRPRPGAWHLSSRPTHSTIPVETVVPAAEVKLMRSCAWPVVCTAALARLDRGHDATPATVSELSRAQFKWFATDVAYTNSFARGAVRGNGLRFGAIACVERVVKPITRNGRPSWAWSLGCRADGYWGLSLRGSAGRGSAAIKVTQRSTAVEQTETGVWPKSSPSTLVYVLLAVRIAGTSLSSAIRWSLPACTGRASCLGYGSRSRPGGQTLDISHQNAEAWLT